MSIELQKTAKGYRFVGADEAIQGYKAYDWSSLEMDCIE